MQPDIVIRSYRPEDLAAVRALHDRAFRILAAHVHSPAQLEAHAALVAAEEYAADLARSNLLLAWRDDFGLLATAGWLAMEDRPQTARIRKVFVHPDWSRRGLARRLVGEAEACAAAAGYSRLYVRANINAVPLYASMGYREETAGMMPTGSEDLPVVFMARG